MSLRRLSSKTLLFSALLLTFAPLLPAAFHTTRAEGQTPKQSCNDPVPQNCAHPKFLGENKGCACFVCNSATRTTRKVVCTRQEADKRALFNLVATQTTQLGLAPGEKTGR